MSGRTGLGRHGGVGDASGDPLDGLVNLFDIGIVLAVAFLIAGLRVTLEHAAHHPRHEAPAGEHGSALPSVTGAPTTSGHGRPVGTVYRLADGRLVYVQKRR